MSRSGYSFDAENLGLYRGAVERSVRGKRGQKFLREMATALDAMPIKQLVKDDIVQDDGHVCAIGSVALFRGMDVSKLDVNNGDAVGEAFDISQCLAREIAYMNDEHGFWKETPAERWTRMREWVEEQLVQT